MSKKNLFLLAAWYVAGWIIASIYWKKKQAEIQKEIVDAKEKWEWNFKIFVDNFIDIHQNMLNDLKTQVMTEENIKLFNDKKDEILQIIDVYKVKWTELIEELKNNWKEYIVVVSEKLELLYNEKREEIESLKWVAPEKITELKNWLLASFEELKNEIKNYNKKD